MKTDAFILPPVTDLRELEPGFIKGTIKLADASLHFEMIEVVDCKRTDGLEQVPIGDPDNSERYANLLLTHAPNGRGYETVEYDGRNWVIHIFPFAR